MGRKHQNILPIILITLNVLIGIIVLFVLKPELWPGSDNMFFNENFTFGSPWLLTLLAAIPLLSVYYYLRNDRNKASIQYSSFSILNKLPRDPREWLRHLKFFLQMTALSLLIIAVARPQSNLSWEDANREGIDIVFSMDLSTSMLAKDFPENRLEAAKKVAIDFIDQRPNDRMGLVVFEGESYTQVPLTTDHKVLKDMFKAVDTGMLTGGTAIGMGLATAVKRLNDSEAKSKVIILLTDGVNLAGNIQPLDAASLAEEFGIRVYTIGIGTNGSALQPFRMYPDGTFQYKRMPVEIDENTLIQIAEKTGGKYFRAKTMDGLEDVYREIDEMERTIIKVTEHRKKSEEYFYFALIGILLLIIEFLFNHLYLRQQL